MAYNRPITSSGSYNLKFVDWDNEFDSVTDHMSSLAGNKNSAQGIQYDHQPYFDVPLSQVEYLLKNAYDCTSTGLSDGEIRNLSRVYDSPKYCSICLSNSVEGIQLPCRHAFHANCVYRWLRCRVDCPNCRRSAR